MSLLPAARSSRSTSQLTGRQGPRHIVAPVLVFSTLISINNLTSKEHFVHDYEYYKYTFYMRLHLSELETDVELALYFFMKEDEWNITVWNFPLLEFSDCTQIMNYASFCIVVHIIALRFIVVLR